jgi:hypothetical protein
MKQEMEQQLEAMRTTYIHELGVLKEQAAKIDAQIQDRRSKLLALDTLLGKAVADTKHPEPASVGEIETFTPVKAYWRPILEVLIELGGRGRRLEVIELVGQKMKGILTKADYRPLPNSPHKTVRWVNRVAWQTSNMRAEGLIDKGRRGIWEITDAGRKWLNDNP